MEIVVNDNTVRIVVIDISKPLGANVYDEAIVPVSKADMFVRKYIDMKKYRIVTV